MPRRPMIRRTIKATRITALVALVEQEKVITMPLLLSGQNMSEETILRHAARILGAKAHIIKIKNIEHLTVYTEMDIDKYLQDANIRIDTAQPVNK